MEKNDLEKLRVPFDESHINYLPKPTKKRDEMDKIPKAICSICGGYHATKNIIHLAYVGHAALTNRLLDVDPEWTWEPLSIGQDGLPVIDKDGGLWIKLTVCGVTRLGYGDAQGKSGGDAMKERIGDALRNAAMRFGAALELWHKGDLNKGEKPPIEDIASGDHQRGSNIGQSTVEPNLSQQAYGTIISWIDKASEKLKTAEELKMWYLNDSNKQLMDKKSMLDSQQLSAANRHLEQTMKIMPSEKVEA